MSFKSQLGFYDPANVVQSIRHIVGFTIMQFEGRPDSEREAAIDRRIYGLVKEALQITNGFVDLHRTHVKYFDAIERAFRDHPFEITIVACPHMEANGTYHNQTGFMEPFYITEYRDHEFPES